MSPTIPPSQVQQTKLCSTFAEGSALRVGQRKEDVVWQLAEEIPVAFVYNDIPHAVMMATPTDMDDFALGFSIAEEIIDGPDGLLTAKAERQGADGWKLCIAVDPDKLGRGFSAQRSMAGRTGCGLCGIEELKDAVREPRRIEHSNQQPCATAISRAFNDLPGHQPMNRLNRSVHAAAFCSSDGDILLCREDVGRHNALDKLIGAIYRDGLDPNSGFVAMTSRCSFELVQKAAAASIPLLATVSAPTALAVDLAKRAGMRLAAQSQPGTIVVFQDDE